MSQHKGFQIASSRLLLMAVLLVSIPLVAISAIRFQAPHLLMQAKVMTDFDAFYVAGTMASQGRAHATYRAVETFAAQQEITGTQSFMPWTYPPPALLLTQGLAALPIGVAYALFILLSFCAYLIVLRRIANEYLPGVLIATIPTVVLTLRTGQNGFLIAALAGAFLLGWLRQRPAAGLALGLMVIKPHLAAGLALLSLLSRRWTTMLLAAVTAILALGIATAALGIGIWPAFMGGVREAGIFLSEGYYPLFRMVSVYAFFRSLGVSPDMAFALHGIGTLLALVTLIVVWRKRCAGRIVAATACMASLFVSPYAYDYDLTLMGLAIALVLRDILERTTFRELAGLFLLSWFVAGYGLFFSAFLELLGSGTADLQRSAQWSLASPALIALVICFARILRRNLRQSSMACRAAARGAASLH